MKSGQIKFRHIRSIFDTFLDLSGYIKPKLGHFYRFLTTLRLILDLI
jgi:hypothetical protein